MNKILQKIKANLLSVTDRRTIAGRLWLIVAGILLVLICSFIISFYVITNKTRRDYEIRESDTLINAVSAGINANLENYKDISRLVMLNKEVINFLRANSVDPGLINDARFGVMDVLYASNNVDSVFILRNDGEYMSSGRGKYKLNITKMNNSKWQAPIIDKRGGAIISIDGGETIYKTHGPTMISILRAIYDINSQKLSGIMMMNISVEMLDRVIASKSNSQVCICSEEGELLSGSEAVMQYYDSSFISDKIVHKKLTNHGEKGMISGVRLDGTPLIVLCKVNAGHATVSNEVIFSMLILFASFLLVLFILSTFVIRNITRPILNLNEAMENVKKSGYLTKIDVPMPTNEIGGLADNYNSLIEYLNALIKRLIDKEKVAQNAQLRVLNEQIKPHFLYNSLETIGYLAVEAGAENVHVALETLGSFYRNFLSKGDRNIPLRREINIIQDYLKLQRLRYGDIIKDEYNIDENTRDCIIPKLLLQPLVENSIYHGIRLKGEEGMVRISSYRSEDKLHILVYDTGVGMSDLMIEEMLRIDESTVEDSSERKSFGLKGTIKRIRYYSDTNDCVKITSEQGEYTQIEIILPIKTQLED